MNFFRTLIININVKYSLNVFFHSTYVFFAPSISSVRAKHSFFLKENVLDFFESGQKYRQHPGTRKNFSAMLPYKLKFTVTSVINKYRNKNFQKNIHKVNNEFLRIFISKDDPMLNKRNSEKKFHIREIEVDESFDYKTFQKNREDIEIQKRDRTFYYNKEFYSHHECACYMAARLPANYAALSYVFNEIRSEEPNFTPSSVFDFGSGVGTTIWVADKYWKDSIKEYFCVDMNENMNQLSRELLRKGTTNNENILNRVFYRQFLPAKHIPSYDLVVSAFSLLEINDTRSRIYVVENLWHKTSGLLVLVEHGSKAGFAAIMEARNFLLQISRRTQIDRLTVQSNADSTEITDQLSKANGSILAPCPHDLVCPRQTSLHKKSYCNFSVNYQQLDYGQENPGIKSEKFTFLIMKKNGHFKWQEEQKNWAKIVEPVKKKSGHTICRICDNDGNLKEIIVSKAKATKHLYKCVKNSKWGDKIPADVVEIEK